MRILICVDDTDDLTKTTSTGTVAELIAQRIEQFGGHTELGITRHQLLLHEDIAYTSHNSSMCFPADIEEQRYAEICQAAETTLLQNIVPSACPGLCVCVPEQVIQPEALIAFGFRAKKEVLKKEQAYELAQRLGGIRLTEHGNTGAGVIGALAGVGLRLSGWDGTFRGKLKGTQPGVITPQQLRQETDVVQILNLDGTVVPDDVPLRFEKTAKAILWNNRKTVMVDSTKRICEKSALFHPDNSFIEGVWRQECPTFAPDNDEEERLTAAGNTCGNCLYRRWTKEGFQCAIDHL